MKVVVDASALLAVVLNEPERDSVVEAATGCELVAPQVLPFEIGNALTSLFKRRLLSKSEVIAAWGVFARFPIGLSAIDIASALALATRRVIYAYDAYVIECALEQKAELLTLDDRMKASAASEGVRLRLGALS